MLLRMYARIWSWIESEKGQDVVEYAVLVICIALVAILGFMAFGQEVRNSYTSLAQTVSQLVARSGAAP